MSTYQIADVAERSGFTAATLRYYEDIGLMPPTERSAAGYRLYDDAAVERLRFIARAKRADAEQGCCRFFGFAIVIDDRGVALEVHAPDSAADVVTALFGAPG